MLRQTHDFVTATFQTVLEQFTGPAVHIGGDELAPTTWSGSPLARAAIESERPTGSLQSRLIEPMHDLLTRAGRRTVVWEDAVHNSRLTPQDTVVLVWQHPDQAHALAARGFDVVLTPGNAYYLDMAHSDDWDSIGGHWAGTVTLEKSYSFEADHGWPADRLVHLVGSKPVSGVNSCTTVPISTISFSLGSTPLANVPGSIHLTGTLPGF